jgi:hypothetical protein
VEQPDPLDFVEVVARAVVIPENFHLGVREVVGNLREKLGRNLVGFVEVPEFVVENCSVRVPLVRVGC